MKLPALGKSHAALFFAGFAAASLLPSLGEWLPDARADQYSCIRTSLSSSGMTGNIPDPEFTITYTIPDCYDNSGYSVQRVYTYGDEVAVVYATTN